MKYRECIIRPTNIGNGYAWSHPNRMDYDDETGDIWQGCSETIEECIMQIDRWYEL